MQPKLRIPASTLLSVLGSAFKYSTTTVILRVQAAKNQCEGKSNFLGRACALSATGMYYSIIPPTDNNSGTYSVCCSVLVVQILLCFISWIMKHHHYYCTVVFDRHHTRVLWPSFFLLCLVRFHCTIANMHRTCTASISDYSCCLQHIELDQKRCTSIYR